MSGQSLDLSSEPPDSGGPAAGAARKFLGIHFACCDVYSRIYLDRDGQTYRGRCPRCLRSIEVAIGPGGTNSRFFTAG